MDIQFNEENGRGRWFLTPEGVEEEAEMTYSRTNAELILVDHTYVPPSARGQGIAEALAKRAVEDAREKGWKIVPVCPYLAEEAKNHDWDDVIQR